MRNDWSAKDKTELVLSILDGQQTVNQAALEHDLDSAEIESWRDLYVGGLRHATSLTKTSVYETIGKATRGHPLGVLGMVLASMLVILVSFEALSESPIGCDDDDPNNSDLCQFHAEAPIVADEVDSNFSKVKAWIEQGTTLYDCQWSTCADTGNLTTRNVCPTDRPVMAGVDVATHDDSGQQPVGCRYTNSMDDMRIKCCKIGTTNSVPANSTSGADENPVTFP